MNFRVVLLTLSQFLLVHLVFVEQLPEKLPNILSKFSISDITSGSLQRFSVAFCFLVDEMAKNLVNSKLRGRNVENSNPQFEFRVLKQQRMNGPLIIGFEVFIVGRPDRTLTK